MADEKILKNERLNNDELDQVSGGGTRQTVGDDDFLTRMGYMANEDRDYLFGWVENSAKVDAGWSKVGITCVTKFGCPDNQYFIGGREISRKDAFRHVLRKKGYSEDYISNYNFDQWSGSF